MIVEVLSPGSAQRDVGEKKALYARSQVPEYWIADPVDDHVDVFELQGAQYELCKRFRASETLRSPLLPGLKVDLGKVFARK